MRRAPAFPVVAALFPVVAAVFGFMSPASAQVVDPVLLNMRDFGGVTDTVFASSRIFGTDDPTEALGNPVGPVEPGTFLFADNGAGGTESMTLNTTALPLTLLGLRITGGGAGAAAGDPRTISAVEVWGSAGTAPSMFLGSIADFDDAAGFHDVMFTAPFPVDQIIISFGTPELGSRVIEIDAIVPEPAALAVLPAAFVLLLRRRARRGCQGRRSRRSLDGRRSEPNSSNAGPASPLHRGCLIKGREE